MRVFDLHIIWTILPPLECQTSLIVDTDVPGAAIFFQIIARWCLLKFNEGAASSWANFGMGTLSVIRVAVNILPKIAKVKTTKKPARCEPGRLFAV